MQVVYTDAHEGYRPQTIRVDGIARPARDVPERVLAVKRALETDRSNVFIEPSATKTQALQALHRDDYISFLKALSSSVPPGQEAFPTVWPPPRPSPMMPERLPRSLKMSMGYYFWGTDTPVTHEAYEAAVASAACALTGARLVIEGELLAYALVRPPGHHAGRASGGGLCFFNNNALAARTLSRRGPVAVLDLDYHHGNGTQELFYRNSRVLTVSIHGDPGVAFPFFTGFADETGSGAGKGYNLNLPLPKETSPQEYRAALSKALARIRHHQPWCLIIALGLDTYQRDPNGGFTGIGTETFTAFGRDIAALGLPTLLVHEGGYDIEAVGACGRNFIAGFKG